MKITPSPSYLPYCRSVFELPTLNQSERIYIYLSDDETTNLTIIFYDENGIRRDTMVSRSDFVRIAEAIKVIDPFRNL